MRCSQSLANGQWLQVKITSVPALPVTSAIDSILPSTFFILVVGHAAGAFAPRASGAATALAAGQGRRARGRCEVRVAIPDSSVACGAASSLPSGGSRPDTRARSSS